MQLQNAKCEELVMEGSKKETVRDDSPRLLSFLPFARSEPRTRTPLI